MKKLIALTFVLGLTLSFTALSGNAADTSDDNAFLIGTWHAMNKIGEDGTDTLYALSSDGKFIYGTSELTPSHNLLYQTGTWSYTNGELTLEVTEQLVAPVGNVEDIEPNDHLIILDNGLLKMICDPAEVETYSIAKTVPDPETGRATITIDGVTFYNFSEQTDLFDWYKELIQGK